MLLYLEDLDHICDLLSSEDRKLEIVADNYRLDNAGEFRKLNGEAIEKLAITSYLPNKIGGQTNTVWLHLYRMNRGSLFASDSSDSSWGLCAQVEQFLRQRKALSFSALQLFVATAIAGCVFFLSYFSGIPLLYEGPRQWHFGDTIAASGTILVLILLFQSLLFPWPTARIILKERRQHKGFIERNWEKILVGVISAILTAIFVVPITIVITRWLSANSRVQQPSTATQPSTSS